MTFLHSASATDTGGAAIHRLPLHVWGAVGQPGDRCRVLLGGLTEAELDAYFAKAKLTSHTKRTVTDAKLLRKTILADAGKGWSLVDQELEDGLRSISVPIVDGRGRILAAMNISGQAARTSEAQIVKTFLPKLKKAADRIAAALRMRRA